MDADECWNRLASVRIGRIALTRRALPCIVPVVFARTEHTIVFNASPALLDRAAELSHVACFECGAFDPDVMLAWSVSVVGALSHWSPESESDDLRAQLAIEPWSTPGRYVQLEPSMISGRSYEVPEGPSPWWSVGVPTTADLI